MQLLNKAFEAPGNAHEDLSLLQMILQQLGSADDLKSSAEVFADLAGREDALSGMTHWKIRRGGQLLSTAVETA